VGQNRLTPQQPESQVSGSEQPPPPRSLRARLVGQNNPPPPRSSLRARLVC
jgi:hypothetical protein